MTSRGGGLVTSGDGASDVKGGGYNGGEIMTSEEVLDANERRKLVTVQEVLVTAKERRSAGGRE